jgi:hypothetical protein
MLLEAIAGHAVVLQLTVETHVYPKAGGVHVSHTVWDVFGRDHPPHTELLHEPADAHTLLAPIAGHCTGVHPLTPLNVYPYAGVIGVHGSHAFLAAFTFV